MTVERSGHPEPAVAWAALEDFVSKTVKMPDGTPPSPAMLKILCFGAWIGSRLATIYPPFALAVTEFGNAQTDDKLMMHTSKMFSDAYMPWLMANIENYLHNLGFGAIGMTILKDDEDAPPSADTGITDTDVLDIMKGLEDFGKAGA